MFEDGEIVFEKKGNFVKSGGNKWVVKEGLYSCEFFAEIVKMFGEVVDIVCLVWGD